MKKLLQLAMVAILLVCSSQPTESNTISDDNETAPQDITAESNIGRNNYAVVWRWKTTDRQIIMDNFDAISDELQSLWKNDIIENVYLDSEAEFTKAEKFPSISFFIKAKNKKEAKKTLNKLTVVTKGIANFSIYPVGSKWLGRQADKAYEDLTAKCYVSVWEPIANFKEDGESIKSQFDAVLNLWNKGIIENVYFDIEGIQEKSNKTDFVFFIHADTEEEAKSVIDKLPFVKNKLTTYKLYSAGNFWLGNSTEKTK